MINSKTPEEVFFKYAVPCASQLYELKLMKKEYYDELLNCCESGKVPLRSLLESAFPIAIGRIRDVSLKLGIDMWSLKAIREYFIKEHNLVIDRRDGNYSRLPDSICELCKVRVGVVDSKKEKSGTVFYTVNYGDKNEDVIGKFLIDAKVGNKISTHWRFAIEVLE